MGFWNDITGVTAAKKAASAQTSAAESAAAVQQAQYDTTQENLSPYMSAGSDALNKQLAISGALGEEAQQAAYDTMQSSSAYTTALGEGEKSILQNASATGGVRGGNTQGMLTEYAPSLLNSMMSDQYSQLGSLSNMGLSAAGGLASAGTTNANAQSDSYTNIGNAAANSATSSYANQKSFLGDIAGLGLNIAGLF